ncbi:MAG: ABC transporter permease subunit [Planctomycetota bacterium]|nr:ABC transporter permease subunit [Planctomycetota bacterium]
MSGSSPVPAQSLDKLWQQRPRNRFRRNSLIAMAALTIVVFATGGFSFDLSARRLANLERFFQEIIPYPLQGKPFDFGVAWDWAVNLMAGGGWTALWSTLAISILAIVLAMLAAMLATLPAARNFANAEPFLPGPRRPAAMHDYGWRILVWLVRSALIVMRAIPEYVWAYLLVATLGLNAWPAILALAIHNAGILGRLNSELVENTDMQVPAALRGLGAGRGQIATFALLPRNSSRLLLYFFYRWETCVREATVLGMLGIASLGYMIHHARAALRYDEMFFLILAGAALVVTGDVISMLARHRARQA